MLYQFLYETLFSTECLHKCISVQVLLAILLLAHDKDLRSQPKFRVLADRWSIEPVRVVGFELGAALLDDLSYVDLVRHNGWFLIGFKFLIYCDNPTFDSLERQNNIF